jgi:hypothetical protein
MANAMMTIHPYKSNGVWMFDDEAHGLVREPFILGMSEILDEFVKDMPGAEAGFNLLFSGRSFPGFATALHVLHPQNGGYWYRWRQKGLDGWLCPALFAYFVTAPAAIYVKAEVPTSKLSRSR